MELRAISRLIDPLRRRVSTMVLRAVLRAVNDQTKWQEVQAEGLDGQLLDGVEVVQPYGLSAHPQVGAEGVMLAVGGNGNHYVMLPLGDRRYRPTGLGAGEVMLHADQDGLHIHLKAGGEMVVRAPTKLTLDVADGATKIEMSAAGIVAQAPDYSWQVT